MPHLSLRGLSQSASDNSCRSSKPCGKLNNLANLYEEQSHYGDAEPFYKRLLAIQEKAFGPDHLTTAQALNSLADMFLFQGRYSDAEPLYRRSLAIWELPQFSELLAED